MNKILFGALATSLVGATGFASDTEWSELDRELAAYNSAAPLTQDSTGPFVSGWLIGAITSDDTPDDNVNDVLGTGVAASRINLQGDLGNNYSFKLGFDFTDTAELWKDQNGTDVNGDGIGDPAAAPSTAGLTDAYVNVGFSEGVSITVGGFRPTVLASSSVQRNHTLFIERSYLGRQYAYRDAGAALNFGWDRINAQIAIMNGNSGSFDDLAYYLHADIDLLGTGSDYEGGYAALEGTNLNIGVTYTDDGSDVTAINAAGGGATKAAGDSRDATQLAFYATLATGGFTLWGEMVDQDDDVVVAGGMGTTPYSVGLGYMFGEQYEVAFRWDDYDTMDSITRYNFGLNYYVQGHDIKWQLNFASGSDDDLTNGNFENDVIALAIAVGF